MQLIFIRHAAVDIELPDICDSERYDQAYTEYDRSGIRSDTGVSEVLQTLGSPSPGPVPVYVSSLRRTALTAQLIFGGSVETHSSSLLDEIPLRSFADTRIKLPFWLWNILARIQWFFGIKRQPETRRQSIARAERVLDCLTAKGEDCIVISHGYFLFVLFARARRRGYLVKQDDRIHPRNLGVSTVTIPTDGIPADEIQTAGKGAGKGADKV